MCSPENDDLDRFRARYALHGDAVLAAIERRVIGADFGANGYTTLEQADDLGRRLGLGPADRLLDVGTGCGWPALHLALTTGCSVVATDVPVEGLRVAARRGHDERLGDRAVVACASATALPFRPGSFDAVIHADVLC